MTENEKQERREKRNEQYMAKREKDETKFFSDLSSLLNADSLILAPLHSDKEFLPDSKINTSNVSDNVPNVNFQNSPPLATSTLKECSDSINDNITGITENDKRIIALFHEHMEIYPGLKRQT
jgi:hypothetical protein